jgi:hypothetical protein
LKRNEVTACLYQKRAGIFASMKKYILKVIIMTSGGALLGALLGYLGQCAGST